MSQLPEKPEATKQEEGGHLIVFDMRTLAHFREEGPSVQVLSDSGTTRLVLFAFKAGQQLKEHHTSSQILVQVVRGHILFTAGESIQMEAGMLVQVEAHVPHSIVAQTDAILFVTMIPSPSYHSLDSDQIPRGPSETSVQS
ncbi:MAG: cupin domain-containing protein [Ktedonobacteraceae bacterium]